MDASSVAMYGAGAGAFLAGVGIGIRRILILLKKTDSSEPESSGESSLQLNQQGYRRKINGYPCADHATRLTAQGVQIDTLVSHVAVVSTDVKWIREKIENGERAKQEETRWEAVITRLDAIAKKPRT